MDLDLSFAIKEEQAMAAKLRKAAGSVMKARDMLKNGKTAKAVAGMFKSAEEEEVKGWKGMTDGQIQAKYGRAGGRTAKGKKATGGKKPSEMTAQELLRTKLEELTKRESNLQEQLKT